MSESPEQMDPEERWTIPPSWIWSTMGEVADVVGGGTPKTDETSNFGGAIPWITPADLSGYRSKMISQGKRTITQSGLDRSGAKLMPAGTVLFSSRAPIGYVAIASNPVATNQGFKSFVLRADVLPDYVYYYLQRAKSLAVARASGTTFLEISGAKARTIPIPLAPKQEQRRIVAEIEKQFTRLDAGVEALKRVQAQLKRYRASVLKAACEGRLVPTEAELARREKRDYEPADKLLARILNERRARWEADQLAKMKAAGKLPKDDKWKAKYVEPAPPRLANLPSLPPGWTYASLIQLAFVASGNTPKGVEDKVSVAGKIPWLKVGDMNRPGNEKYLHGADAWLSKDDAAALGMHVQPKGTIVFPKRGGAIATNKKRRLATPSCYDLNCMGLIPLPTVSEFIWWWFASINLGTLSDGANIPQLNHGDIEPLVVPLPPLKEQSRIVTEVEARLSVVEVTEFAIASNGTRAAHLRQAVLKTAFEGALVPQDPRDEPASKLLERISAAVENKSVPNQRRAKQTTAVPQMKATR